jgi:hypothetical protein
MCTQTLRTKQSQRGVSLSSPIRILIQLEQLRLARAQLVQLMLQLVVQQNAILLL